jgi:flagellar FliJ protein
VNPDTLALLVERAKEATDTAQLRFANLQRLVEQARKHLEVLRQYAREYDERATCRPGDLRDPSAQQNQMSFLARLQQAIATQEREMDIRQGSASAAATELAQCRKKQKSLETLLQRQIESLRLVQARRDQKSTDEFAQRAHDRAAHVRRQEDEFNAKRVS